jgi:hypothetical protein
VCNIDQIQALAEKHFPDYKGVKVKAEYSLKQDMLYIYIQSDEYLILSSKSVETFFYQCKLFAPLLYGPKTTYITCNDDNVIKLVFYLKKIF